MEAWKKAVVLGAIGSATFLFMKKRYPAGVLATGVGLAVLASEYPEKVETARGALPGYFERGIRVLEMESTSAKCVADAAGRCSSAAWVPIGGAGGGC